MKALDAVKIMNIAGTLVPLAMLAAIAILAIRFISDFTFGVTKQGFHNVNSAFSVINAVLFENVMFLHLIDGQVMPRPHCRSLSTNEE